jgi:hypothetical protein
MSVTQSYRSLKQRVYIMIFFTSFSVPFQTKLTYVRTVQSEAKQARRFSGFPLTRICITTLRKEIITLSNFAVGHPSSAPQPSAINFKLP